MCTVKLDIFCGDELIDATFPDITLHLDLSEREVKNMGQEKFRDILVGIVWEEIVKAYFPMYADDDPYPWIDVGIKMQTYEKNIHLA